MAEFRKHEGILGRFEQIWLAAIPVVAIPFILRLPSQLGISIWLEQYLSVFLLMILVGVFLTVPARRNMPPGRLPWYDILFAVVSVVVCVFLFINFPDYQMFAGGIIDWNAVVLGTVTAILLLEATRRLFGWALVGVTVFFILYALFADYFPKPFTSMPIKFPRLMQSLYMDNGALTGITLNVGGTLVLAYIIFGRFLFMTKGGDFLIDLALGLFGKYRGGAGKATVTGSSFFGAFTGVAVANVYTTGAVTIPMMKKHGIDPETAGAIEATASTGSLILPPIMGIVAFIMALYLHKTYAAICIAAIVPAVLYYIGVYVQVDRYAARNNLPSLDRTQIPNIGATLKSGWFFLLAFAILIYTLFIMNWDAEYSALAAAAALFLLSMLRKDIRMTPSRLFMTAEDIGRSVLEIGTICALVGLVVGCLMFSGLALSLANAFVSLSGGMLFPLMLLVGVACILLGMGLPIVTVYILAAVILVPALDSLGINPMASHMFVFYYSMVSFLTPPVCLSIFAASTLAKSKPMGTAVKGMRFAIAAYVVPFAFIYDDRLLLEGGFSFGMVFSIFATAMAIVAVGTGFEGFLFRNMKWFEKAIMVIGGLIAMAPADHVKLIGLIVIVAVTGLIRLTTARSEAA